MSDDKILTFPGSEPLPENSLVLVEKRDLSFCQHPVITLDDHERVVRCDKCGKVFDPFTFLREQARRIQTAWQQHRQVMNAVHDKSASVSKLLAEEKRLRAQVRRLKDKTDPIDLHAEPKP